MHYKPRWQNKNKEKRMYIYIYIPFQCGIGRRNRSWTEEWCSQLMGSRHLLHCSPFPSFISRLRVQSLIFRCRNEMKSNFQVDLKIEEQQERTRSMRCVTLGLATMTLLRWRDCHQPFRHSPSKTFSLFFVPAVCVSLIIQISDRYFRNIIFK